MNHFCRSVLYVLILSEMKNMKTINQEIIQELPLKLIFLNFQLHLFLKVVSNGQGERF